MFGDVQLASFSALILASLGSAPITPVTANFSSVECEIQMQKVGNGVVLSGQIHGTSRVDGEFIFMAEKNGPSGNSQTMQSGEFSVDPGKTVATGTIMILLEPQDRFVAEVELIWPAGKSHCQRASS